MPPNPHDRDNRAGSTAEVVALPHKDAGINLTLAAAEARAVTMGSTTSVDGWNGAGSAARVEGSVWVTNLALSTYCNLMLSVPDELTSVATTLYCMVRGRTKLVRSLCSPFR